jgi:hypothetical protein
LLSVPLGLLYRDPMRIFSLTKLQELKLRIEDTPPSIIVISEVKPKNFKRDIQLSEFNIDGYELLSTNISKETPGRGMLLYVKDSLKYSPYNFKFLGLTSDMAIIDEGVSSILSFSSCNFVCVKVSALVIKMLNYLQ